MVSFWFVLFVMWKDVLVNGSKLKHSKSVYKHVKMENNKLSTKKVYTVCRVEAEHVLRLFLKNEGK